MHHTYCCCSIYFNLLMHEHTFNSHNIMHVQNNIFTKDSKDYSNDFSSFLTTKIKVSADLLLWNVSLQSSLRS